MKRHTSAQENRSDRDDERGRSGPGRRDATRTTARSDRQQTVHAELGNQAVRHLYESGALQAKLTVSDPSDPAERAADRIADEVVRSPESVSAESVGRASRDAGDNPTVSADGERRLRSLQGGGRPLSASTREFFEPRFGRDLSQVRVHTGSRADEAARSIDAKAFALGDDVGFAQGEFRPETRSGRRLIAHELAHVVGNSSGVGRQVVHRQDYGAYAEAGAKTAEDIEKLMGELKLDLGMAKKPFKYSLITFELMRTQVSGSSQAYKQLTETINGLTKGLEGLEQLESTVNELPGKIEKYAGGVETVLELGKAVSDVGELDPEDLRDNPEEAAKAFEGLAETVGKIGEDYLPEPLVGYATFVKKVGTKGFFSNFVALRRKVESQYGTFGNERTAEALDQWFEHGDMVNTSAPRRQRELSDEAIAGMKDSAEELSKEFAQQGNVELALRTTQVYAKMVHQGASESRRDEKVAQKFTDALQEAIDAWSAYQSVPGNIFSQMGSAHETKIKEAKQKVDALEPVAREFAKQYGFGDEGGVVQIDLVGSYGMITLVKEQVQEVYDDVSGYF